MGDAGLAADITQEAFISAYRKLSGFRGGSFKGWILRIVTNAAYDELRRMKRHPTVSLEPLGVGGEEFETAAWLEDPGETPEEATIRTELAEAIQHCLNELSEDFRLVVVLVDVQGLEYAEAADALRRPVGTIKSRLARARLILQECLRGFGELLPGDFRLEDEVSP